MGTLTLLNSFVFNNLAQNGSGGGLFISQGSATISQSRIFDNTAACLGCDGGGIFNAFTTTQISNNAIFSNNANGYGGGFYGGGAAVTISQTTISGNRAYYTGGGLDWAGGLLTFANGTVSGNQATVEGGGGINMGCPPVDQRGLTRPVNGICDIGAVEFGPIAPYPHLYLTLVTR